MKPSLRRPTKAPSVSKASKSHSPVLVELERLREHEGVSPKYLEKLKKEIESDGILKLAIAVDKNTNVILDGHHRFNALKKLGCKKIPVVFVDYASPDIAVKNGKTNKELAKNVIIQAALTQKKLPPKATHHVIRFHDGFKHISVIEKRVNIPLEKLKGAN